MLTIFLYLWEPDRDGKEIERDLEVGRVLYGKQYLRDREKKKSIGIILTYSIIN